MPRLHRPTLIGHQAAPVHWPNPLVWYHHRAMTFIFPVLDLLNGQVVRAVRGDRQNYRPIESALCNSSEPVSVAKALCDRCESTRLYVADLDAIQGRPAHVAVLQQLLTALPEVELWIDAGFANAGAAAALCQMLDHSTQRLVPVFGSESLASRAALAGCFASGQAALSLDRRDGQKLDAAGCWDAPELWPQRVIVMTLERVGSDAGPDLQTISEVRRLAPQAMLIGAGGLRDQADLQAATQAGADAWLVASALHDLRV
jgi:phosphoribosyl isomerase A